MPLRPLFTDNNQHPPMSRTHTNTFPSTPVRSLQSFGADARSRNVATNGHLKQTTSLLETQLPPLDYILSRAGGTAALRVVLLSLLQRVH